MGCCGSSIPDVIIPDPEPGQKCDVLIKKTGMLSSDQYIYQDRDEDKKWLFLDKAGGIFGAHKFYLENFVRDDDDKGKVLCSAEMSDGNLFDGDVSMGALAGTNYLGYWARSTEVKLFSDRDRKDENLLMTIEVKGKGTLTAQFSVSENDDGSKSVSKQVQKTITSLTYECKYALGEGEEKENPTITVSGDLNGDEADLRWECSDLFTSNIDGGKAYVQTEAQNSGLGLLAGYICAKELSPKDLLDNVEDSMRDQVRSLKGE